MIKLGQFELHVVSDGFMRLDGGAMFGIVPRTAWEKVARVDEKNRIFLSLSALLIRTGSHNVLVDAGIGEKDGPQFGEEYAVDHFTTIPKSLQRIGLSVSAVDVVIFSHLHFDHAGGATERRGDAIVPRFPNAEYVVQKGMWREAQERNPRTRGSYHPDDFLPLEKEGKIRFVEGDCEVVPGVSVRVTGGHVRHHQVVLAESGGKKAIYWGDLIPTTNHLRPAWGMSYDLYPGELTEKKIELMEEAARGEWLGVFEHDPETAIGVIRRDGKKYVVDPLERPPQPEGWE